MQAQSPAGFGSRSKGHADAADNAGRLQALAQALEREVEAEKEAAEEKEQARLAAIEEEERQVEEEARRKREAAAEAERLRHQKEAEAAAAEQKQEHDAAECDFCNGLSKLDNQLRQHDHRSRRGIGRPCARGVAVSDGQV